MGGEIPPLLNMTRDRICYDLKLSPFRVCVDGTTYVFSSYLHKQKFIERYHEHRTKINNSLSTRFNINTHFNKLSDLLLYQKIEKRNYLLIHEGVEYKCQQEIKLNGEQLIKKLLEKK